MEAKCRSTMQHGPGSRGLNLLTSLCLHFLAKNERKVRGSRMAQWGVMLAAKADGLNLMAGTHLLKGEHQLWQVLL